VLSELHVSWRTFVASAVAPAAIPAVFCYIPLVIAYRQLDKASPVLLLVAALCSLAYAAALWRFLEPDERAALRRYVAVYLPVRPATEEPAPVAQEPR